MSFRKGLVGLGLTTVFTGGVIAAVDQVGEMNTEKARVEACISNQEAVATGEGFEELSKECDDYVVSAEEVAALEASAQTTGVIGWIAFAAATGSAVVTINSVRRDDY